MATNDTSPAVNPELAGRAWPAHWAALPHALTKTGKDGAVFLFRKSLTLDSAPSTFVVHLSADQRYRLYVNGQSVCFGPARGDLMHWHFESVDLAPYLKSGVNTIAVRVHFFTGEATPVAQMSSGYPGLVVQGNTEAEAIINTPSGWRATVDEAYTFSRASADALWTYSVVGPSEIFDTAKHPDGWLDSDFDDSFWSETVALKAATAHGTSNAETHWWLVPRTIPLMEETPGAFGSIRRSAGLATPIQPGAGGEISFTVPAHSKVTVLFDHGVETCAFPTLTVSGGKGGVITLSYAEALQTESSRPNDHDKGNRDEIDGKVLRGYVDTWQISGGESVALGTLWWRTFRYAELTIETREEPLTIESLTAIRTGYPWEPKATFSAPERPELARFREVGWRTLRLCTHETFTDCPYYEQLQYAGDSRIQCLASLYETGDTRLFASALRQFDESRASFGLTMSRYPSRVPQVIPPFSLWWICMVHDYWRHVPGSESLIRSLLPGVTSVLGWFTDRLRPDGLLGALPHWNFVDWSIGWPDGAPPGAVEGGGSIVTLQFVLALQAARDLFAHFGQGAASESYAALADRSAEAVRQQCFDAATHRVADSAEKQTFSQHGGILAVLAGLAADERERQAIVRNVLTDASLTQATFYCRFYLNRALAAAGLADEYLNTLGPWHDMLALGLTTWAEKPEPTRSDCHAWSSSPNYEFLATVLGVAPGEPGWATTAIAPALGALTECSGVVPIPGGGEIAVSFRRESPGQLHADVTLPQTGPGSSGTLSWKGVLYTLRPGQQELNL